MTVLRDYREIHFSSKNFLPNFMKIWQFGRLHKVADKRTEVVST